MTSTNLSLSSSTLVEGSLTWIIWWIFWFEARGRPWPSQSKTIHAEWKIVPILKYWWNECEALRLDLFHWLRIMNVSIKRSIEWFNLFHHQIKISRGLTILYRLVLEFQFNTSSLSSMDVGTRKWEEEGGGTYFLSINWWEQEPTLTVIGV